MLQGVSPPLPRFVSRAIENLFLVTLLFLPSSWELRVVRVTPTPFYSQQPCEVGRVRGGWLAHPGRPEFFKRV